MLVNVNQANDAQALNSWGQVKTYGPNWTEGTALQVLKVTATPDCFYPPHVMTAELAIEILDPAAFAGLVRWRIQHGVGGAQKVWKIDGAPLQQVSFPAGQLQIDVMIEPFDVNGTFSPANSRIRATAFVAVGNTSTREATLTQGFAIAAPLNMPVPEGATSFRLIGERPAVAGSPFAAGALTVEVQTPGVVVASFVGADTYPDVFLAGDYFPLPGGVTSIQLTPVGAVNGAIQWGLDL